MANTSNFSLRRLRSLMATKTERAILAGGCFWGMQQLIRRRPGVLSHKVGYSGGDVPKSWHPRRGDRDRLQPRRDDLSGSARIFLPDPRSDDAEPARQRPRHELPFRDLLHE